MALDYYVEMDARIGEKQMRSLIFEVGADIKGDVLDGFYGEFRRSQLWFDFHIFSAPKPALVDRFENAFAVSSILSARIVGGLWEASIDDLRKLAEALISTSSCDFVMSYQGERVLAARTSKGVQPFTEA